MQYRQYLIYECWQFFFLTPFAHKTTSAGVLCLRPLTLTGDGTKCKSSAAFPQSKLPPQFQGLQIQNLDSGSPLPSMHSSSPRWNRLTSQQTSGNNLHTQFHILTKVNKTYFQKINFHMVAIIKPFQDLWYFKNKKNKWHNDKHRQRKKTQPSKGIWQK